MSDTATKTATKTAAKRDVLKSDISVYNQIRNVQQEIAFLLTLLNKSSFYNSTIQDKLTTDMLPFFDNTLLEVADEIVYNVSKDFKDVTPYRT